MSTITINEFDISTRKSKNLRDVELISIPTKEDKIALEIDGTCYIFKIIDVIYHDFQQVDIYVLRLNTIDEYVPNYK